MSQPASASGLYDSRWRKLRAAYLQANPLCVMCKEDGRTSIATELDHKIQHHGNRELFFDWDNLQGLCNDHHRSTKARQERSGKMLGCDGNGYPIHPQKHWQ